MSDFDTLADDLIREYALDLPPHVADRAFGLAWEHGHAHGDGEVEMFFIGIADIAGDAYRAGFRDGGAA